MGKLRSISPELNLFRFWFSSAAECVPKWLNMLALLPKRAAACVANSGWLAAWA